jgi:hypothetical protein
MPAQQGVRRLTPAAPAIADARRHMVRCRPACAIRELQVRRNGLDTLRIARDLSEGNVFSHEQAERLGNAFATYWAEVRSELVTKEYLDARLAELEAKFDGRLTQVESRLETRLAQMQNKILGAQVALFVLLGVAIYFK